MTLREHIYEVLKDAYNDEYSGPDDEVGVVTNAIMALLDAPEVVVGGGYEGYECVGCDFAKYIGGTRYGCFFHDCPGPGTYKLVRKEDR